MVTRTGIAGVYSLAPEAADPGNGRPQRLASGGRIDATVGIYRFLILCRPAESAQIVLTVGVLVLFTRHENQL